MEGGARAGTHGGRTGIARNIYLRILCCLSEIRDWVHRNFEFGKTNLSDLFDLRSLFYFTITASVRSIFSYVINVLCFAVYIKIG